MSGINGISLESIAAFVNAVKVMGNSKDKITNSKPPAPWRSHDEFNALRAAKKCTRCGEKGHWFKKCPHFTYARRPVDVSSLSATKGLREISHYSDNDSGKE